jgi:NAD(P)-dependent dehydrogenase (short-subunit alcohol dehydrogenase family)
VIQEESYSKSYLKYYKCQRRKSNVSSLGGSLHYMQEGGAPAYSISKAALNVLTRKLAVELQGTGILVNSIDPGWLATELGGPGGGW